MYITFFEIFDSCNENLYEHWHFLDTNSFPEYSNEWESPWRFTRTSLWLYNVIYILTIECATIKKPKIECISLGAYLLVNFKNAFMYSSVVWIRIINFNDPFTYINASFQLGMKLSGIARPLKYGTFCVFYLTVHFVWNKMYVAPSHNLKNQNFYTLATSIWKYICRSILIFVFYYHETLRLISQ